LGGFLGQQRAVFQQPAEILLTGMLMPAFAGLEIFQHFIIYLQPFQMDEADKFIAAFPDLALSKFQRHKILSLSLLIFASGETRKRYFFFLAAGRFFAARLALAFFAIILIYCG
jgi:hypothetical protein